MNTVESKQEDVSDRLAQGERDNSGTFPQCDSTSAQDVILAHGAASGSRADRANLTERVHHLISRVNDRLCKRHCQNNRYEYACTIDQGWGRPMSTHHCCEFGNASYAWIMHDLVRPGRLANFKGRNGARLEWYFSKIVYSIPFRERWRNWRFGKQLRVPDYVNEIDPDAGKVFRWMANDEALANIAQRLGRDESTVARIRRKIGIELVKRGRLHMLIRRKMISLTGMNMQGDDGDEATLGLQADISSFDPPLEKLEIAERLWKAWDKLNAAEQFVLDAMCIDSQDAKTVLNGLKRANLSIRPGLEPAATTRQQLYYFKRKCCEKLFQLAGFEEMKTAL